MTSHRIETREEWLAASAELLAREKKLTRMGDELAWQRRELPWVPGEKHYTLQAERTGWSFTWASGPDSDFNVDFGISAGEPTAHDLAAPQPEANELALLKLLQDQSAVRDNLPLVAAQNASATGTDLEGYFSEGHGSARSPARTAPLLLQLRPRYGVPDDLLASLDRARRVAAKAISP